VGNSGSCFTIDPSSTAAAAECYVRIHRHPTSHPGYVIVSSLETLMTQSASHGNCPMSTNAGPLFSIGLSKTLARLARATFVPFYGTSRCSKGLIGDPSLANTLQKSTTITHTSVLSRIERTGSWAMPNSVCSRRRTYGTRRGTRFARVHGAILLNPPQLKPVR